MMDSIRAKLMAAKAKMNFHGELLSKAEKEFEVSETQIIKNVELALKRKGFRMGSKIALKPDVSLSFADDGAEFVLRKVSLDGLDFNPYVMVHITTDYLPTPPTNYLKVNYDQFFDFFNPI